MVIISMNIIRHSSFMSIILIIISILENYEESETTSFLEKVAELRVSIIVILLL